MGLLAVKETLKNLLFVEVCRIRYADWSMWMKDVTTIEMALAVSECNRGTHIYRLVMVNSGTRVVVFIVEVKRQDYDGTPLAFA